MENPVGTGPYRLKSWTRGQRIVLEANPDYRDDALSRSDDPAMPATPPIAKGLAGRRFRWSATSRSASSKRRSRAC